MQNLIKLQKDLFNIKLNLFTTYIGRLLVTKSARDYLSLFITTHSPFNGFFFLSQKYLKCVVPKPHPYPTCAMVGFWNFNSYKGKYEAQLEFPMGGQSH